MITIYLRINAYMLCEDFLPDSNYLFQELRRNNEIMKVTIYIVPWRSTYLIFL